jgi:hypothetical protein
VHPVYTVTRCTVTLHILKVLCTADVSQVYPSLELHCFCTNFLLFSPCLLQVMSQLRTWYGSSWPSPTNSLVTRWWNDPWSFGSYSYYAVGSLGNERNAFTSPQNAANTNIPRVWFAGEHVSVNYPSTMQGAFLTGQSAAAKAATAYPKTTTVTGKR